ncbi:hypothetical protein [Maribacter sp. 2308TA10-17]|uniref:hypothetical protein n=1 Tax=Maribacter sp. 2308TA10-17 TaxID=3386276 RepID=UPI0039BC40DD
MKAKNYFTIILLSLFTISFASAFVPIDSRKAFFDAQEPIATIIESLENGESYSIEITSVGCFGGSRQTIRISKEREILTASFPDFSKTLSTADIEAFRTFELQLHQLQMGGCSTVDTYVIRYKGHEFRTSDGTCSWNGGKKLLKAIS